MLDLDLDAAKKQAAAIGPNALAVACDVTKDVLVAFGQVIKAFGGVDIVVSNAGAAWQGRIGDVDEAVLREKFRDLASDVLTAEGIAAVEQALDRCEHWTCVSDLPALLTKHQKPH